MPLLFLLILAIIEFGFMMRDVTALQGTSHAAVRAAAVSGNSVVADQEILAAVAAAGAPLHAGEITTIVVFKADGPGSEVPAGCVEQSSAAYFCNTYQWADVSRPRHDFGCREALSVDRFWCPLDREVAQAPSNGGPPDYIGIHLVMEREMLSGMFGKSQRVTATEILRIEPQEL